MVITVARHAGNTPYLWYTVTSTKITVYGTRRATPTPSPTVILAAPRGRERDGAPSPR
jgi:hypothetical protein